MVKNVEVTNSNAAETRVNLAREVCSNKLVCDETSELHRLHDNMVAADIVFGKAVLKQHGKKLYNLRRYQPVFDNAATELARQEFRTATDAWRKAYKRATE